MHRWLFSLATIVLCGLLQPVCAAEEAREIKVAGSTTLMPLVQSVAEHFHRHYPNVRFVFHVSGSTQGIAAVGDGEAQLGLASRAIDERELRKYPNLQSSQVGRDGIALVVHASNPVSAITSQQVRAIYMGEARNWADLGGRDASIVPLAMTAGHGTLDQFSEHFGLKAIAVDGDRMSFVEKAGTGNSPSQAMTTVDGSAAAVESLVKNRDGIAFLSLGAAVRARERKTPLKILAVDGIVPTVATLFAETYTLQRPLLIVTDGTPDETVAKFLHYLMSSAGQRIVEQMDCLPINTKSKSR